MAAETVLITGASSGIGWELAQLFAADKSHLILVARRRDKLEQLANQLRQAHGVEVHVLGKDLADPTAPQAIFDELASRKLEVDVLVNNAGFGAVGPLAELPLEKQMQMVQVNICALTHLTRLLLPGMIGRGHGGVLNVGSTAGFQPGPYMAVYYATKAYVLSLSEALAEELAATGVRVTCLAPGATATGFAAAAQLEHAPLFKLGVMDARRVAQAGYRAFRKGTVLCIPGLKNKLGAFAIRFAPRRWVPKITRRLQWPA
jgi:uncharacterized protein